MKPVLDISKVEKLFLKTIGKRVEKEILKHFKVERNEEKTGYINRTDYISSKLIDFCECVKSDGSSFLKIKVKIETEYEIEIEKTIQKDINRYKYVSRINPRKGENEMDMVNVDDYPIEQEFENKVFYPLFFAKFEISNKGKKIGDYKLIDITLE